jgi:hypothetical protein
MKKLILIPIILICANIQSAMAQNYTTVSDSAQFKCSGKNNYKYSDHNQMQLLAYCEDTAKQQNHIDAYQKQHREKVREMLDAQKKAYYTKVMNLTDAEAKAFFPVLDKFEEQHRKIMYERRKLSHSFEIEKIAITDSEARQINKQLFNLQKQEFDLVLEYMKIFEKILSPKQLFMFHKAREDFMRGLIKNAGTKQKHFPQTNFNFPQFNFDGRM